MSGTRLLLLVTMMIMIMFKMTMHSLHRRSNRPAEGAPPVQGNARSRL